MNRKTNIIYFFVLLTILIILYITSYPSYLDTGYLSGIATFTAFPLLLTIFIATAIGVGLGSRYPYASRARNETPIALMITFPVISWVAIIPVLIFQLGFLPGGVPLMLLSSVLVAPYTIILVVILLSWSAHSYLRQE